MPMLSRLRRLAAWLGSVYAAALLIATIAAVVAAATLYERAYGAAVASVMVYRAWWFAALFAVLALCLACAVLVRLPLARHQWGFALAHLGLIALIAGFWVAGRDRLDGLLEAAPGSEAARIALPHDEIVVLEGERRWRAELQPIAEAHYPSLLGFLLYDLWFGTPPAIVTHTPPRPLLSCDGVGVGLRAVLDTGALEPGFAPGAGPPAVHVAFRAASGEEAPRLVQRAWLSPAGETILDAGLVLVSLAESEDAAVAADFLAARAPADPEGELVFADGGALQRWPARSGERLPLADGRLLAIERVLLRPLPLAGELVDSDDARLDPVAVYRIRRAEDAEDSAGEARYAPAYILAPPRRGEPWVRYEHPLLYRGAGGQGLALQLLIAPDAAGRRQLLARWFSRSRGLLGTARIDGAWQRELLGSPAMRLSAELQWLPAADPAPEPLAMRAGEQERAVRWVQLRFQHGEQVVDAWLRRDSGREIRLGSRALLVHYRRAAYDLRAEHGFAIRLERFEEGKDPGGQRSASYASIVTVLPSAGEPWTARITMNEPLTIDGVTLYQTAFRPELDAEGRPTGRQISVFTAASDAGRPLKYLGSGLLVAGIALHYLMRRRAS
ncbi:MAG: cytochrome c biogenesis protein ResB [Planctomycetes bacterium]|nr:cytochrome c biogenesis protein ResB [Planctomycetota bacterium]